MRILLTQAFLIASKDSRQFFRDRLGVGFALAFPLLFVFAFSLALSDQGPADEQIVYVLALRDSDQIGRTIAEALVDEPSSSIRLLAYEEAQAALDDGDIPGYVAFPDGFDRAIARGQFPPLIVELGTDDLSTRLALQGVAQGITARVANVGLATLTVLRLAGPDAVTPELIAGLGQEAPLFSIQEQPVGELPEFSVTGFVLPGYLTMFVFFAAALSAESIARERKNQTLERLLANGTRRNSIILGKYLSSVYRGFLQLAVLWVVGVIAFDINLGSSPWATVLVSMLMVLASAGFGLLIASFVSSVRAASSAGVLVSLVFAPLGGCWWPLFIAPEWQQELAKVTPHGWANDAFNRLMLFGADGQDVLPAMVALVGFGIAFMAVAMFRFRTAPS